MAQAHALCHRLGGLQLHHMPLPITKAQGMHLKALSLGHGDHGGRVQTPAEQDNGFGQKTGGHELLSDMGWYGACELDGSGPFAQSLVYDDQPDQTTALGPHKHLLNLQLFLEFP